MKKYIMYCAKLFLVVTTLGIATSCSDYLTEDLTTKRSTEYYKTDEGIQSLAVGTYYQVLDVPFAGEMMFSLCNSGTDEFHIGGDASNGVWNAYDSGLKSEVTVSNANTVMAENQWNTLYVGIGLANQLIKSATESASTSDNIKKTALGEGYFFRAYNYLRLVRQYGGVPLKLTVSSTVELEFTRASAEEILKQVIDDFTQAYTLLSNQASSPTRVTKDAAAHFLAKAYLTRASEINDTWNSATKKADLENVVTLSDEVINRHPLATNFGDLWNYTEPDGDNEFLSELILSAQFTADKATAGSNFQTVVFTSRYDDMPQMKRDLTGMRPYSRLAATYFTYGAFDQVNDSRFWKSFRTKSRLNNPAGDYYVKGDLGIMYVINQPVDNRFATIFNSNSIIYAKTGKTIPSVYVAYSAEPNKSLLSDKRFPSLSKHFDAARTAINDNRGIRDMVVARSAETYLMAAEAKIRLAVLGSGSYASALEYINAVRMRATYKDGENREAYTDGGAAYPVSELKQDPIENSLILENSYYESNNIPIATSATDLAIANTSSLPAQDEAIISKLGISGDYNRMLCLVLNERSRELVGEFLRWEDLSRTKTLEARAKAYNPEAAPNIKDYHCLRAIPQTFLNGIQTQGRALTSDEKQAMQNPGY